MKAARRLTVAGLLLGGLACGGLLEPAPTGPYVPGSVDEAHTLCAEKDPAGCDYLGALFEDPAARKDHERTFETYVQITCDEGLASSCYELGVIRLTGQGGRADKRKAARRLEQACELGNGRACFTGGVQIRRGDGVPRNGQKALDLLERACELNADFKSCAEVGQLWTTTEVAGGPDKARSETWYTKACEVEPTHPFCAAP